MKLLTALILLFLMKGLQEHLFENAFTFKGKYYKKFPQLRNFHSPDMYIGTFKYFLDSILWLVNKSYKDSVRVVFKINNL